ncbi:hypothetical protein QVD17_04758 [Tagetes erecta]|uniref:Uncharacterized protein n=1 Tax=Tagetes erecta TaxID=13708 RepID=A0AAD8P4T4_TARER|nr:hypothetical protein QVD17_04758 [Tagetes erecta]
MMSEVKTSEVILWRRLARNASFLVMEVSMKLISLRMAKIATLSFGLMSRPVNVKERVQRKKERSTKSSSSKLHRD